MRRPTLKDVAALAEVSFKTVSRVVAKDPSVNDTIKQRVESAIKQLGYSPNRLARALRSGQTKSLAMVIQDVTNPFYAETSRTARLVAAELGYQLSLYDSGYQLKSERTILEGLVTRTIDGIILSPIGANRGQSLWLHELNIPHVLLDVLLSGNSEDVAVSTDHSLGIASAVKLLRELGHKHIALLIGSDNINSNPHLVQVFERDMGSYFRSDWVISCDFRIEGAYLATCSLIKQGERPTAIISFSDVMALGIYKACRDFGMRIPEDIAVVGYDDIPMAEFLSPSLTTVRQETEILGREAVFRLIDLINGGTPTSLVLPPELIIRQST